jgi:hypothetical protein
MNDEFEMMSQEVVVVYFEALSQNWLGGTTRNINQDNPCPGRDSNRAPSEYKLHTLPPEGVIPCLMTGFHDLLILKKIIIFWDMTLCSPLRVN